jgi:hypothetical protein
VSNDSSEQVSKVTPPVKPALQTYQAEAVGSCEPWLGSPLSRVAPSVVPVTAPIAPDSRREAAKASFAGGSTRPQRRVKVPTAPLAPSTAMW